MFLITEFHFHGKFWCPDRIETFTRFSNVIGNINFDQLNARNNNLLNIYLSTYFGIVFLFFLFIGFYFHFSFLQLFTLKWFIIRTLYFEKCKPYSNASKAIRQNETICRLLELQTVNRKPWSIDTLHWCIVFLCNINCFQKMLLTERTHSICIYQNKI